MAYLNIDTYDPRVRLIRADVAEELLHQFRERWAYAERVEAEWYIRGQRVGEADAARAHTGEVAEAFRRQSAEKAESEGVRYIQWARAHLRCALRLYRRGWHWRALAELRRMAQLIP